MHFVYYFKNIEKNTEKEYIKSILSNNILINKYEELKEKALEIINFSHDFIREYGDISSVSLREISRFSIIIDFFKEYYDFKLIYLNNQNKDEIKEKDIILNCIILGIYICYYIRLFNPELRNDFEINLNEKLNKKFLDIPNEEKEFIINEIELEPGIGKNNILKENIFLMFISIITRIPLIICGKPGCSKSLSFQLIFRSMKGKFSNSGFFRNYPSIIRCSFQGSISTSSRGVSSIFKIAEEKLKAYKEKKKDIKNNELPISLVYFDELGLAERSKDNPLKVLHSKLEYDDSIPKSDKIGFIGISNWSLDAAKMNRAIYLYVPELDSSFDNINDIMTSIVKSINPFLLRKYENLFLNLSNSYFEFKKLLREKKTKYFDSISSRDFYHLIKNCAKKIDSIINSSKSKNRKKGY